MVANTTLQGGDTLSWYRIEKVLGRGAFGITYLALDTNLDKRVAIKEYLPASIAERHDDHSVQPVTVEEQPVFSWGLERFIKEAQTLAKFTHPNIVRVMSVFENNHTAYMVMEFEQGQDLKQKLLDASFKKDEASLKRFITPIIEGLSQVHTAGFIHRDIKPANLYIREDNTPVLLDFGSARQATGQKTANLTSMVSAGYAPMEQYHNSEDQQGPWTDIYALGALLYFIITGAAPVDSTQRGVALLNEHRDPLSPLVDIAKGEYSPEFLQAIDWALNLKAADRPQSLQKWKLKLLDDDSTMLNMGSNGDNSTQATSITPDNAEALSQSTEPSTRLLHVSKLKHSPVAATIGIALLIGGGLYWQSMQNDSLDLRTKSNTELAAAALEKSKVSTTDTQSLEALDSGAKSVDVVLPWIPPSDAPEIDGFLDRIWDNARYHDNRDDLLAIDRLMIGEDAQRSNGNTEYQWAGLQDGTYLYLFVFAESAAIATPYADSKALWADDNLNLFVDGDNSKSTSYDGVNDIQIMMPMFKHKDPLEGNNSTDADGRFHKGDNSIAIPEGFMFATCHCKEGQKAWEIRLDIAKSGIELGKPFGIELQIDDDYNGDGRDAKWGWRHPAKKSEDLDKTWINPSFMGTALLALPPNQ